MHRARTKSTQPTTQLINLPENIHFKQLESNSRQKSAYKNSQCLSNRHKSSKTLQYHSGSKSSLPNVTHKL